MVKIKFREDQKEIMKYSAGTMGIQAVPGAGKTFIITNLVSKLIENMDRKKGQRGKKILVLTYMNSACNNFKSRIKKILDSKNISGNGFEVMTIHSLALKILRENTSIAMVSEESSIVEESQRMEFLRDSISDFDPNFRKIDYFVDRNSEVANRNSFKIDNWRYQFENIVSNCIKLLKYGEVDENTLSKYVDYKESIGERTIMKMIYPIYSGYQKKLKQGGFFDYDDILIMAYNVLRENDEVSSKYKNRYEYIFEDECQDSNSIQSKIINLISNNLVRVGDINQSITGTFTGADPNEFIEFIDKADQKFDMDMASRSSEEILYIANSLIKRCVDKGNNALRAPYIRPVGIGGFGMNPEGNKELIKAYVYDDSNDEKEGVVNTIEKIRKINPEYSIGILLFYNKAVDEMSEFLTERDIEHDKIGGNLAEYRQIFHDLRNILNVKLSPNDDRRFFECLVGTFIRRNIESRTDDSKDDKLAHKIDDDFISDVVKSSSVLSKKEIIRNILSNEEFYDDISEELSNVFKIDKSNIKKYIEQMLTAIRMPIGNYFNIFEYIGSSLNASYEERCLLKYLAHYFSSVSRFENIGLSEIIDRLGDERLRYFDSVIDSVYLMGEKEIEPGSTTVCTLHKSKGLEWDVIIMPELTSSLFPAKMDDWFHVDRGYLKNEYKYPEALFNKDLDEAIRFLDVIKSRGMYKESLGIGSNDGYSIGDVNQDRLDIDKDIETIDYIHGDLDMDHYEKSLKTDLISERIRLLYVGITRAKSGIIFSYPKKKLLSYRFSNKPAEYLKTISKAISYIDSHN